MLGKKRNSTSYMGKTGSVQEERKYVLRPNSNFYLREAFKTLRVNVNFSLADATKSKVIVVTSSMQGEGKSLTAVNLAISLAQMGKKVMLIDCDLRRPKLNRLLNLSAAAGVSNVLINPSFLEVALLHSQEYGIDVMLSGDIPHNPTELLGSVRAQKLINGFRKLYDFVIIDTPPVGVVTDAAVLAPYSDGVLFVVRANWSERAVVGRALEQLEYAKAKILGFVLNGVDSKNSKKKYSGYRGYGRYEYAHKAEQDAPKVSGD